MCQSEYECSTTTWIHWSTCHAPWGRIAGGIVEAVKQMGQYTLGFDIVVRRNQEIKRQIASLQNLYLSARLLTGAAARDWAGLGTQSGTEHPDWDCSPGQLARTGLDRALQSLPQAWDWGLQSLSPIGTCSPQSGTVCGLASGELWTTQRQ